ncbi:hypothetical protein LWI28_011195 [Acer negundo]|uniref:Uncharacterized protein n=1 Tax=Acer negundo TaxID=4023 RepID=A0AAD5NJD4_ACENE|nr:hypothetical protein LWI28_011195 [Acer negundo]
MKDGLGNRILGDPAQGVVKPTLEVKSLYAKSDVGHTKIRHDGFGLLRGDDGLYLDDGWDSDDIRTLARGAEAQIQKGSVKNVEEVEGTDIVKATSLSEQRKSIVLISNHRLTIRLLGLKLISEGWLLTLLELLISGLVIQVKRGRKPGFKSKADQSLKSHGMRMWFHKAGDVVLQRMMGAMEGSEMISNVSWNIEEEITKVIDT